MPVALIGAGIAAAGGVASAVIGSNAANSAANQAAQSAAASNALQKQIYDQNVGYAQPYMQAGTKALTELQNFLGLGGDPAAAQAALQNYLNSTGYQFVQNEGLNQVAQSKAAAGLLGSGGTLTALQDRAANIANTYGQQYEQNLQGVVNTGQQAQGSLAGVGSNYANAVSNNNASAASTAANAGLTSAQLTANAIKQGLSGVTQVLGQSSYGGGSGNNPFADFNAMQIANANAMAGMPANLTPVYLPTPGG